MIVLSSMNFALLPSSLYVPKKDRYRFISKCLLCALNVLAIKMILHYRHLQREMEIMNAVTDFLYESIT